MNINWQDGERREYEVYPDGTYKVLITGWDETKATTGTPQIKWKAEILEPESYHGKSIVDYNALTENSLWKLASFVACIVNVKNLSKMEIRTPAFHNILNACIDRTMMWRTIQRTYKGKLGNNVEEYKQDPDTILIEAGDVDLDDVPSFLKEDGGK